MRAVRYVAVGGLAAAAWAALFRLWMRAVSDDPSFTWTGTMYIVLAPTVLGTIVHAVILVRERRRARRVLRAVLGVLTLSLGMAAGAVFLPTLVFGTLAYAPRLTAWGIRLSAGLLAMAPVWAFWDAFADARDAMSGATFAATMAWYAAICIVAVLFYSRAWGASFAVRSLRLRVRVASLVARDPVALR